MNHHRYFSLKNQYKPLVYQSVPTATMQITPHSDAEIRCAVETCNKAYRC